MTTARQHTTAEVARFETEGVEEQLNALMDTYPASLTNYIEVALTLDLDPVELSVLVEVAHQRRFVDPLIMPEDVWRDAATKLERVMLRAIREGSARESESNAMPGDWGSALAKRQGSVLGAGWRAFSFAIAVQEWNASMGLVAAAPTGGASGTIPGALAATGEALGLDLDTLVGALFVAGLVGKVAFGRGPVSGAQAGCGGEIGVAAMMAAAAVAYLYGGSWADIDAAAALAGQNFVGLECCPEGGRVVYPCVPRNGSAAMTAMAFGEAAANGQHGPYSADYTLDRIYLVGGLLPTAFRETGDGPWAMPAAPSPCQAAGCRGCQALNN